MLLAALLATACGSSDIETSRAVRQSGVDRPSPVIATDAAAETPSAAESAPQPAVSGSRGDRDGDAAELAQVSGADERSSADANLAPADPPPPTTDVDAPADPPPPTTDVDAPADPPPPTTDVDASPEISTSPTTSPTTDVDASPGPFADPVATPMPTSVGSGADSTPTPAAAALPTSTPTPTPTPTVESTATPTPTVESTPTPTPTVEPTPTPTVEPTSGSNDTQGLVDDDALPPVGNGQSAPDDGDSRANPQRPESEGFLIGSVSGPTGDRADWSSFTVEPGDPTELFAGIFCDNFSSPDGTGLLAVTVFREEAPVADLQCTQAALEDFAAIPLDSGATYFVAAEFSGNGYTDWFFQASDDD